MTTAIGKTTTLCYPTVALSLMSLVGGTVVHTPVMPLMVSIIHLLKLILSLIIITGIIYFLFNSVLIFIKWGSLEKDIGL